MKGYSTGGALFNFQYAGIGILAIIYVVWMVFVIIDNYKDKNDECRIYKKNLNIDFAWDTIYAVDKKTKCASIGFIRRSIEEYKMLNDTFIYNVSVGDVLHKFTSQNTVIIKRGKIKIKLPFAKVPNKDCK